MNDKDYEIILRSVYSYIQGRLHPLIKAVGELDEMDIVEYRTLMDICKFIENGMMERKLRNERSEMD